MATTTELRSLATSLSDRAGAELALLWAQLEPGDIKPVLMEVIPALVGDYGDASSAMTAEWYDEYRVDLGIGGGYRADLPPATAQGAEALAGWGASLITADTVDLDAALTRITGGLQRRIANASRETITFNTFEDPQARGWQRSARPDGCGFCQMVAGRGTVYRSQGTADFASHDHCHCSALPAFGGRPVPVRPYTPTARHITDADRARTREWIAAHI